MRSLIYTVSFAGTPILETFSYNMAQAYRSEGYTIATRFIKRREPRSEKEKARMQKRFRLLAEAQELRARTC